MDAAPEPAGGRCVRPARRRRQGVLSGARRCQAVRGWTVPAPGRAACPAGCAGVAAAAANPARLLIVADGPWPVRHGTRHTGHRPERRRSPRLHRGPINDASSIGNGLDRVTAARAGPGARSCETRACRPLLDPLRPHRTRRRRTKFLPAPTSYGFLKTVLRESLNKTIGGFSKLLCHSR